MAQFSHSEARTEPEYLVHRLTARLGQHVLWDALLLFMPPLLVSIYGLMFLAQGAAISQIALFGIAIIIVGAGAFAATLRCRSLIPKVAAAARLADQRSGAKDHFLTLATIDAANCPAPLLARLRAETAGFVTQIALRRDFPYKVKRPAYYSMGGSLLAALLLYFLPPLLDPLRHTPPLQQQLRQLAKIMTQRPPLKDIAEELKALAAKLEDAKLTQEEKRGAVQDAADKIADEQKKQPEKEDQNLLGQAASALKGGEQQQSAGGQEQQKGGGGIQSNLPQDGKGEGKQYQGSGGDSKGETKAQLTKEMSQGKSAQGDAKEPGQDKNQPRPGDAKNQQPDPNQAAKEPSQDKSTKGQGGSKDGAGKNQPSSEPPQGGSPAERFYKAGEGKGGLKDARYVTVQLPEDLTESGTGDTMMTKESKPGSNKFGAKVPASNVPLPAHMPNAPAEKQPLPMEYRGIIR